MPLSTPDQVMKRIEKLLTAKAQPQFRRYGQDIGTLLAPLKWKPLVLVIGNYSSGKSTLINELLGRDIQRVGQAPTDDAFTIVTKASTRETEREIPGATVVNDEQMPFTGLRAFGERFFGHLRLKYVDSPILQDLAIIDTPGMLDSVTEKDRGYAYLEVIGELARLADVIILMFDPHKAGTIKETYQAIRSTLPGATGEDRVFFVMNRIDECVNTSDLLRSYGTLCWNLSQMTGRKDIPRIFLTFNDAAQYIPEGFSIWRQEREELKQAIATAPRKRLNHIFEEVDRGIRELAMEVEAYRNFRAGLLVKVRKTVRHALFIGLGLFLVGDIILNWTVGFPEEPMFSALVQNHLAPHHLLLPVASVVLLFLLVAVIIQNIVVPAHGRQTLQQLDSLLPQETPYRQDLWRRIRGTVAHQLKEKPRKLAWQRHAGALKKLNRLLEKDLRRLFLQVQKEQEKNAAAPGTPE